MSLLIPPTATNMAEWVRKAATAINSALSRPTFTPMAGAPANPDKGQAYFDETLSKARVWDGSAWQNLY